MRLACAQMLPTLQARCFCTLVWPEDLQSQKDLEMPRVEGAGRQSRDPGASGVKSWSLPQLT